MTVSIFQVPHTCDATTKCKCEEFAAVCPEAASLIEETWNVFAQGRLAQGGSEAHFRILPYTGGEPNVGRVEVFLIRRQCGSTWPRFSESHFFHLSGNLLPHLRIAALLAQYEIRPPITRQEMLDALRSGEDDAF